MIDFTLKNKSDTFHTVGTPGRNTRISLVSVAKTRPKRCDSGKPWSQALGTSVAKAEAISPRRPFRAFGNVDLEPRACDQGFPAGRLRGRLVSR